jgi:hypothetical protein
MIITLKGFFLLSENRIGVKIEHTHLNKKYSSLEGQFLAQYKNYAYFGLCDVVDILTRNWKTRRDSGKVKKSGR